QYLLLLHRWPNLENPVRFSEWIQWYKMKYRNPDMLRCVDKYDVRNYLKEKGCREYVNRLYQVCDKAEEIDFEKLPDKFVIKTTSGGSGDNVVIVMDKAALCLSDTVATVNCWLRKNYSDTSREWAYSEAARHPKIIVEEYLENTDQSLDDYKFYCFKGKFKFLCVDKDRYFNHRRAFFDENLLFLPSVRSIFEVADNIPVLPENIKEMITLSEYLSRDFPFVRVDLYNVCGRIIFGELTFYPGSGYSRYYPDDFDHTLGRHFPSKNDEIWTRYMHVGK
ncbi:MAG: hypothetical protein K2H85_10900, partial [Allobaculum sp.]|nr:hypothetical protein [Allobaculum sp.]